MRSATSAVQPVRAGLDIGELFLGIEPHLIATSLAAAGHEVTVVTRHAPGAPLEEYADGVRIVRAPEDPPLFPLATPSLLAWTMAFNHTLTRAALRAASRPASSPGRRPPGWPRAAPRSSCRTATSFALEAAST
jgi:hypothetical protein